MYPVWNVMIWLFYHLFDHPKEGPKYRGSKNLGDWSEIPRVGRKRFSTSWESLSQLPGALGLPTSPLCLFFQDLSFWDLPGPLSFFKATHFLSPVLVLEFPSDFLPGHQAIPSPPRPCSVYRGTELDFQSLSSLRFIVKIFMSNVHVKNSLTPLENSLERCCTLYSLVFLVEKDHIRNVF